MEPGTTCDPCAAPRFTTPGTRLTWSTVDEWLAGWRELQRRKAASKKYEDERRHLEALPDAVVERAGLDELDALEAVVVAEKPPRGKRAGHVTTRLQDAVDRRRAVLRKAPPRLTARRVVDRLVELVRARLPTEVDVACLYGFVHRHRAELEDAIRESEIIPVGVPRARRGSGVVDEAGLTA